MLKLKPSFIGCMSKIFRLYKFFPRNILENILFFQRMSSFFRRIAESTLNRVLKKSLDKVLDKIFDHKKTEQKKEPPFKTDAPASETSLETTKANPWRLCPAGEHWVRRHPKHLQLGIITDHDGHCRKNPSKKDLLKGDEMDVIATSALFLNPKIKVSKNNLKLLLVSLEKQNQYDDLISGWTVYWNDVFQLKNPLHPNYVKALIATESTFNSEAKAQNPKPTGLARGLMQITEETTRHAKDYKLLEYRDHYIDLEYEDLWNPNKNIAFGIRHLFRKRETAK